MHLDVQSVDGRHQLKWLKSKHQKQYKKQQLHTE